MILDPHQSDNITPWFSIIIIILSFNELANYCSVRWIHPLHYKMVPRKRNWKTILHNENMHVPDNNGDILFFEEEIQQSTLTFVLPLLGLNSEPGHNPSSPPVVVHHGCLLIPFCFTVWWYWTRKVAQNVARRVAPVLCRIDADAACFGDDGPTYSSTAPSFEATSSIPRNTRNKIDPFQSWQDVVSYKSTDPSVRRVRWFKGWNPRSQRRRRHRPLYSNNDNLEEGMISSANPDTTEARSTGDGRHQVRIWNDIEGIELWEIPPNDRWMNNHPETFK